MKNKHIIISGIALFLITILLLGLTYAYYKTKVIGNTNEKTISSVGKKLEVTYTDGNGVIEPTGKIEPGYTATKTFSVKNTGDETATYSIKLDNITNTFTRTEDWKYTLTKANSVLIVGTIPTYETTLLDSIEIKSGETQSYSLMVRYTNIPDVDQSIDMGATLSLRVNIDETVGKTKNSVTFIGNGNTLENYRIYGNSVQNGIPTPDNPVDIESVGDKTKNLFDPSILIEQGWTKEEDGSYYVKNNATVHQKKLWENTEGYTGQLRISYKLKYLKGIEETGLFGSRILIVYKDGSNGYVSLKDTGGLTEWKTVDLNTVSDASKKIDYIMWMYGMDSNSTWVKDIMITKDIKSDEYEPYGYKIPVTVTGKNLWNVPEEFSFNCLTLKVNIQPGTYKIVADSMYIDDVERYSKIYVRFQKNQRGVYLKKSTTITLTTKEDTIYFYSYDYDYITSLNHTAKINKLMLMNKDEDTTYEPYQETATTIYLNEPLRKVGDYADYIDFKEQKVVRNIKSELMYNKNWQYSEEKDIIYFADNNIESSEKALCTVSPDIINKTPEKPYIRPVPGVFRIYNRGYWNNLDTFKTWLNEHQDYKVEYLISTPTEETIKLPNINTINGTNHLTVNSTLNPSHIEINS